MAEKIDLVVDENPKDFDTKLLQYPRDKFELISVDRVERYKRSYMRQISGSGKLAKYYVNCMQVWETLKCKKCGTVKRVKDDPHIGCKEGPCSVFWKDLSGQQVGNLTVLSYEYTQYRAGGKKAWYWKCRCACGKTCYKEAHALLHTGTQECPACAISHRAFSLTKENGGAAWNQAYHITYNNAIKRGYMFELSMDKFKELCSQPCYYCGKEPCIPLRVGRVKQRLIGYRSGIDRMDNSIGYVPSNCVPCCPVCNSMKTDHPYDAWIAHMERILKRHKERSTTIPEGSTPKQAEMDSVDGTDPLF